MRCKLHTSVRQGLRGLNLPEAMHYGDFSIDHCSHCTSVNCNWSHSSVSTADLLQCSGPQYLPGHHGHGDVGKGRRHGLCDVAKEL